MHNQIWPISITMETPLLEIPGYEMLGELGRGGMGIVYRAWSLKWQRVVALKMILNGRGAGFRELARFRIEAEAIASLKHPHIVRIHEIGVHLGFPFFVLEFAEGGNLAEHIKDRQAPCGWAARITLKLARAMEHAHSRRIIHRDLKPQNILMTGDDHPKITDFGLAKFTTVSDSLTSNSSTYMTITMPRAFTELVHLRREEERIKSRVQDREENDIAAEDALIRTEWIQRFGDKLPEENGGQLTTVRKFVEESVLQSTVEIREELEVLSLLTREGAVMGTPQYMAPEQTWGVNDSVGPSADIYSLGAILYQMLTGRPPFVGSPIEVLISARTKNPQPPRAFRDSIAPDLEAICLKCLAKDAPRRYESMTSLAADLHRFVTGGEVSAVHEAFLDPSPSSSESAIDSRNGDTPTTTLPGLESTATADAKSSGSWRSWQRLWSRFRSRRRES